MSKKFLIHTLSAAFVMAFCSFSASASQQDTTAVSAAPPVIADSTASPAPAAPSENSKKDKKEKKVLAFTHLDSLSADMQYYLNEYRGKYFEDPTIPRFLIHDRSDHFVFGVGGYVAAQIFYDRQGTTDIGFTMPEPGSTERSDIVRMNLYTSRLSFFLLGKTKKNNVINAYIETDFCGESKGLLRLRQAYVDFFGFRVGQAWTYFADEQTLNMIEFNSEFTTPLRRFPMLAYRKKFKNGLIFKGGFEFSRSTSMTEPLRDSTGKMTGVLITTPTLEPPDLTLNLLYDFDRVHLYGGVNFRVPWYWAKDAGSDGATYSYVDFNWAAQVSGNVAFVKRADQVHKFFFQGIYTRGMNDCVFPLDGKGLSLILDEHYNKHTPSTLGGALGYQATWGKTMANNVNLSLSYAKLFNNKSYDHIIDSGGLIIVNYLRNVLTYGTVGAEFVWGKDTYVGYNPNTNFRVYLLLRYNF